MKIGASWSSERWRRPPSPFREDGVVRGGVSLDASRPRLFAFVTIDVAAALNIGEAAVPRALHAF